MNDLILAHVCLANGFNLRPGGWKESTDATIVAPHVQDRSVLSRLRGDPSTSVSLMTGLCEVTVLSVFYPRRPSVLLERVSEWTENKSTSKAELDHNTGNSGDSDVHHWNLTRAYREFYFPSNPFIRSKTNGWREIIKIRFIQNLCGPQEVFNGSISNFPV